MDKFNLKISLKIKKAVLSILSSDLIAGTIRKIYNNKIPHYSKTVYTNYPEISNRVTGNIFFKAYENSEISFVKKYLYQDLPVVEIGASIGVMALQLSARTTQQIHSIEANPALIRIIENNIEKNKVSNCAVYNYIIANAGDTFYFVTGNDNTTGHITTKPELNALPVKSISLSLFLSENNISNYILVCDIEGAEIYILKNDIAALRNCKQIIIELHDTSYNSGMISINEMAEIILNEGFEEVDSYGANKVYNRK